MAALQQVATIEPEYTLLDGGGQGMMPVARAVHSGSLALTATTGTDTKSIRIKFDLPNLIVWQLRAWYTAIDTTEDYARGAFEMYVSSTLATSGASQQFNFSTFRTDAVDTVSGSPTASQYILGGSDDQNAAGGDWVAPAMRGSGLSPFDLINFKNELASATLALFSTNAPTAAGVLRFNYEWLGYTYEQVRSAAFWFGFNNRN